MSFDNTALAEALNRAADLILSETDALTRADQAIGDGDHGIGMARGFTAVKEALAKTPVTASTVPMLLEATGKALLMKTGGSSGAIFGTLFLSGSKVLMPGPLDAEGFARFLEAGLEAVQSRGGAKPGDKTLVDALAPAAAAARAHAGGTLAECLRKASEAAWQGMESTRDLVATLGRARTLGPRSVGHIDPGALSFALMLRGLAGT